jgi:hypothetical protein
MGPAATRIGGTILRGTSLVTMAQTVGILVAAGLLAAIYNSANEETRAILQNIRSRRRFSQARHEAILMTVLGSELALDLQDCLLNSHDAFRAAMILLASPLLSPEERDLVRRALHMACQRQAT